MDDLEKFAEEFNNKFEQFKSEGLNLIRKFIQNIFDNNPNINSLGWIQYTPYFNDGDPCEFCVYADVDYGVHINCDIEPEYEIEPTKENNWNGKMKYKDIRKKISKIANTLDSSILESLGEGKVIFYRDGTHEIEEYYHD